MLKSKSVRRKLFYSYVIAFILPLAILSLITYYWATTTMIDQAKVSYQALLEDNANLLDRRFNEIDTFVNEISKTKWINKIIYMRTPIERYDRIDYNVFLDYLQQFVIYNSLNDFIDEVGIYFNQKDLVMSSVGKDSFESFFTHSYNLRGMDLEDWNILLNQFNDRILIEPAQISSYGREYRALTYVKTLPDVDAIPKSTAIIAIREDTVKNILSHISFDDQTSVYVFDEYNNFLLGTNTEDGVSNQLIAFFERDNSDTESDRLILNDKQYFVFTHNSDIIGWKYATIVPASLVLAKANNIGKASIVLLVVLILVGLILSYIISYNAYRPVDSIISTISTIFETDSETSQPLNEYESIETAILTLFRQEQQLKETFDQNMPMLQNSYLLKLLDKKTTISNEFYKMLDFLGIEFNHMYYMCMCILDPKGVAVDIKNLLDHDIPSYNIYVVDTSTSIKNIILNFSHTDVQKIIDSLQIKLEPYIDKLTVGIGGVYASIGDIHLSYSEAIAALDYRFLKGDGEIIRFEDIKDNNELYYYPKKTQDAIINCLKSNDPEKAYEFCLQIIDENMTSKKLNIEAAKSLGYNILSTMFEVLHDIDVEDLNISVKYKLFSLQDIDDMKIYLYDLCHNISQKVIDEKQNKQHETIHEIIQYIDSNYTDPNITLAFLADKYGFSEPYLSTTLKKYMGCTFTEYLSKKRIDFAKELLLNPDNFKIADISEMVGYENDFTFRRAFSRYAGVSPSQFKKLNSF